MIRSFTGEYHFLSNFYPLPLEYGGITYPTAEHAFQAYKSLDIATRRLFADVTTPAQAKAMGRRVSLRPDWETVKDGVMFEILTEKFRDPWLADALVKTGDEVLVEGNSWGDTYWGVCNGQGKNRLGLYLMLVRSLISLERS